MISQSLSPLNESRMTHVRRPSDTPNWRRRVSQKPSELPSPPPKAYSVEELLSLRPSTPAAFHSGAYDIIVQSAPTILSRPPNTPYRTVNVHRNSKAPFSARKGTEKRRPAPLALSSTYDFGGMNALQSAPAQFNGGTEKPAMRPRYPLKSQNIEWIKTRTKERITHSPTTPSPPIPALAIPQYY